MRDGVVSEQSGIVYRLRRDAHVWILSMATRPLWRSIQQFSEDPQTPGDIEVANHFTSTHPESIFRKTLTIQRAGRDERTILRSDTLTRYRQGRLAESNVTRDRLREVVRNEFAIDLPHRPLLFESSSRFCTRWRSVSTRSVMSSRWQRRCVGAPLSS